MAWRKQFHRVTYESALHPNFSIGIPWYDVKGPRDYLAAFPDEAMKFTPGESFSYSNGGYILLGVVIEELSGLKYQTFVEQSIFEAIGMNRSGYFALNKLPEQTAIGYVEEANGWRTNVYNLPIVGASDGGAFTTPQDIATLWDAFWGNRILSPELVDVYTRPFVKAGTEGRKKYYGHGLWLSAEAGRDRDEFITGCDAGVSFESSMNQADGTLVTVMSNTTHGAWPIVRDVHAFLKRERV